MLTREEQIGLVQDLMSSITSGVIAKINEGKIPESWDGHELRYYLADIFDSERTSLMKHNRKRRKNYHSDVYMNNL